MHAHIIKYGFQTDRFIATSVVSFYSSSSLLTVARQVFDVIPDKDPPLQTTMLLAYLESGEIAEARILFDEMYNKDVVAWNAMLTGYVRSGHPDNALELFREMQNSKIVPNEVTLICALSACSQMGCLELGEWIHAYINRHSNVVYNMKLKNSLIHMYSKCGRLDFAFNLFLSNGPKNLETWNTMLSSFAIHGCGSETVSLFSQMIKMGVLPDGISVVAVLMGCSHRGMVYHARSCFNCVTRLYGIEPEAKHYNCMVDVLSRGGYLDEARLLIGSMPFEADTCAWGALLNGCFIYRNYVLGVEAGRYLLELEPKEEARYIALLNLYNMVGKMEDAAKLRKVMVEMCIKQSSGISMIEVDGVNHEFVAGDRSHLQSQDIYSMIHTVFPNLDLHKTTQ